MSNMFSILSQGKGDNGKKLSLCYQYHHSITRRLQYTFMVLPASGIPSGLECLVRDCHLLIFLVSTSLRSSTPYLTPHGLLMKHFCNIISDYLCDIVFHTEVITYCTNILTQRLLEIAQNVDTVLHSILRKFPEGTFPRD